MVEARIPLNVDRVSVATEMLCSGKADVIGGDAESAQSIADGVPGAKIVPGAFNTLRVAVALPKGDDRLRLKANSPRSSTRRNELVWRKGPSNRQASGAFGSRQIDLAGSAKRCLANIGVSQST